ncbi:hypothetical protein [Alloactinosynnema sp. L-07]|uniref:hypothetical protein n=1 Tax=Alloactinosynnema sp. L-07 TaxID=1653480 RepID=UPI00065EFE78|nr:hypothetical protein [Alloactinosynnema sp. L-07]CRK57012.1 hypothetical protein [Alloactinosynnema sp. L-07]
MTEGRTGQARLGDDELGKAHRVIPLFRDTYQVAQGRQWVQAQSLWWVLLYLRDNGIRPDWAVLGADELRPTVTSMGLPAGHGPVDDGIAGNFSMWWTLFADLAGAAYLGAPLPDATRIEAVAWEAGLRPWNSSGTYEEISGVVRAMDGIRDHIRDHRGDPEDFLARVLAPSLLITELVWLHTPEGRPGRHRVRVLLPDRYGRALNKLRGGGRLSPVDHMYLNVGALLGRVEQAQPAEPHLVRVAEYMGELARAQAAARATPPLDSAAGEVA